MQRVARSIVPARKNDDLVENTEAETTTVSKPTRATRTTRTAKAVEEAEATPVEMTDEQSEAASNEPPAPPTATKSRTTRRVTRTTRAAKAASEEADAAAEADESHDEEHGEEAASAATTTSRRRTSAAKAKAEAEDATDDKAAQDDTESETAVSGAESKIPATGTLSTVNVVSTGSGEESATRRRRGGRRVVRGAGAAGASLELQVEETKAASRRRKPAAEETKAAEPAEETRTSTTARRAASRTSRASRIEDEATPVQLPDLDDIRAERDEDGAPRATRSRTRSRSRVAADDYEAPVRRASRSLPEVDERDTRDNETDEPTGGRASTRSGRPMTSLLFQEPVLPSSRRSRVDEDDDEDDIEEEREERVTRSSRSTRGDRTGRTSRATRSRRDMSDDRAEHDDSAEERDDAGRDSQPARGNRANRPDEEQDTASRRSNRRLNAQERRAAAEVEQIEEDLELDDIVYAPISEEDLSEGPTRSRRRRRRGGAATEDRTAEEHEDTRRREPRDEQDEHETHEEDADQSVTRRRRRRRGKGGESEVEDQIVARRSRKQQYIDEITDIEGSTRLEAKKQRRRDNRRERSRQSQLMEQDFLARRENVDRLMVVREKDHHTQISVVEDNILVEHYVSDIQEVQTVGNIYLGRVQNVLPSMEAAFVDIGQARNGVLYAGEVNWDAARLEGQPRRIELAFKSGDPVLVQVTKDPIGHKGARLTSQVTLAGRFLVLVPSGGMTGVSRKLSERERSRLKSIVSKIAPKDMGVIIRTAAEGASEEAIVKDLENLVRQWERITSKRDEFLHGRRPKLLQGEPDVAIRVVRDIFNDDFNRLIVEGDKVYDRIEEYLETMAPDLRDKLERWDPAEHEGKDVFDKWQIDSQLRKGMERQVYLPSGGSIVIDRTEAMTTIDVNTGRFIGKGRSLEETVTRCNLEASEEIARQLRLRDIGGMVMIDYVDMVMPANRDLVLRRLVECLARDRTKHQVAEVTSLGLVQMTRKRIGQGLVEAFSEECPTCRGRGFILHDQPTVSAEYDDPYAMRGGDPFVKTNKHGQGTQVSAPQGSSADVKAKLAQIAAAAVAANNAENAEKEE